MGRINELLHSVQPGDGAFLRPKLFLFGRRAGAGLIRDRPAAALSLAERLAHPCCLIGTGSLLTRASDQQRKQTVRDTDGSDQLSSVPRKGLQKMPRDHLNH